MTDWAERDRRKAATERYYAEQHERERAGHVATVERALSGAWFATDAARAHVAEIAVDALYADGVVFARMGMTDA